MSHISELQISLEKELNEIALVRMTISSLRKEMIELEGELIGHILKSEAIKEELRRFKLSDPACQPKD